jgi:predicted ATPase/DNA-binding SARP family transcriptional activator
MRYRLLGPLEVLSDDGVPVPISGERERDLLATLLLEANRAVSSGRLIEAIWGHEEPPTAANALQVHVSKLRRKLADAAGGESPLKRRTPGYVIEVVEGELDVDVVRVLLEEVPEEPHEAAERLREALACWRGGPLADVGSSLLLGDRIRLEEFHTSIVERRINADLACGRHRDVIAELESLVQRNPLRESFRSQLVLALYRSGRQSDALARYSAGKERLAEALGVDPGPELQALELAILKQDEAIAAPVFSKTEPGPSMDSHLPVYLTSFVARDQEQGFLRDLVESSRLVTVTGPGGCGKTRLAVEAARLFDQKRPVWWADLSQFRDDRFVGDGLASALGLSEEVGIPVTETVATWIGEREALLLVDNCEHVIDAAAKVVDSLLHTCPRLSVLATSREPLSLDGERVFRVPSLAFPSETANPSELSPDGYAAIELLVSRASDHDPTFQVSANTMPAVASICRRLDGMPLAIELAAGCMSSMSPEEVERQLGHRFQLLRGGSRAALPRQRTLAASIDWSFDLLGLTAQVVLARASTMSGSFSLEAAESVCNDGDLRDGDVPHIVGELVDRNLVGIERSEGETRYRLGETIREYAFEKLQRLGPDVVERSQRRHAAYFAGWMERRGSPPRWAFAPLTIAQRDEADRALVKETSNLVAASAFVAVCEVPPDVALRLAYGAGNALKAAYRYGEAVDLLHRVLTSTRGGSNALRGQVQRCHALGLFFLGRYDDGEMSLTSARAFLLEAGRLDEVLLVDQNLSLTALRKGAGAVRQIVDEAIRIATESASDDLIAFARAMRGAQAQHYDKVQCRNDLESAVSHFKRIGCVTEYLQTLYDLAQFELETGDPAAAKRCCEETLQAGSSNMTVQVIATHMNLANAELELGNVLQGVQRWTDAAEQIVSHGIVVYYVYCVLVGALCCTAAAIDGVAARLIGAHDSLVNANGEQLPAYESKRFAEAISALTTNLGAEEFEHLRREGTSLRFVEAHAMAAAALRAVIADQYSPSSH